MKKIQKRKKMLVAGGCGFIGSNAAVYFYNKGWDVTVLDNLSRKPGSHLNKEWMEKNYPKIRVVVADLVKDRDVIHKLVGEVDAVLHQAAQVAVTLSIKDPEVDLHNNLMSTFHILEAIRQSENKPMMIYSSTNKVYGESSDIKVAKTKHGHRYADLHRGISEKHPLDFHSPYGCSKGAADQYVRDYARIYGLPLIVFRQSCIYGSRQFGSEDQGWVAWFAIQAAVDNQISIYGDGHQSRDILHVEDLCRAYELALENISKTRGQIYNVGGGHKNQLSLLALIKKLESHHGRKVKLRFADWRSGDQKVFMCDIRKAKKHFGWTPKINTDKGVSSIIDWIDKNIETFNKLHMKS